MRLHVQHLHGSRQYFDNVVTVTAIGAHTYEATQKNGSRIRVTDVRNISIHHNDPYCDKCQQSYDRAMQK